LHINTPDRLPFVTFKLSYAPFGTLLGALIRLYHPHLFLAESQLELHYRPFGNRTEKITIALTTSPNTLCSWIGLSWSSWTSGIRTKRDMWKCLAGLKPGTPGGLGLVALQQMEETEIRGRLGKMPNWARQELRDLRTYMLVRRVTTGGTSRMVEGSTSLADNVSEGSAIVRPARPLDEPKALDARELATLKFFGKEADLEDLIQERKVNLAGSLD